MKVCITCESSCDLPLDIVEKYNIKVIPLIINFESESLVDGVDANAQDLFDRFEKTGELPKTAARGVFEYEEFFEKTLCECDQIVHISLSSHFSSSYSNALVASQKFENVTVVDSKNLSTGYGLVVLAACDLALQGNGATQIGEMLEEYIKNVEASFVLNTLKFIHKGGRCSAIAMLGANLLKIKPMIAVVDGKMKVAKKYIGKFSEVVLKYVKETLDQNPNVNKKRIFITYSSNELFEIEKVQDLVNSYGFEQVITCKAGCTVASHCGPNCIGILFAKNF